MIVCPLTSVEYLERELTLAEQILPEFLEFRTDVLPLDYLDYVKNRISKTGIGLVLTVKCGSYFSETLSEGLCFQQVVDKIPLGGISYADLDSEDFGALCLCGKTETGCSCFDSVLKRFRERNVDLILSHHCFELGNNFEVEFRRLSIFCEFLQKRVRELKRVSEVRKEMLVIPKFAYMPNNAASADRFTDMIRKIQKFVIGVAMGEYGKKSRKDLYLEGNLLSYAYLLRPNAPGQCSAEELRIARRTVDVEEI